MQNASDWFSQLAAWRSEHLREKTSGYNRRTALCMQTKHDPCSVAACDLTPIPKPPTADNIPHVQENLLINVPPVKNQHPRTRPSRITNKIVHLYLNNLLALKLWKKTVTGPSWETATWIGFTVHEDFGQHIHVMCKSCMAIPGRLAFTLHHHHQNVGVTFLFIPREREDKPL